MFVFLQFYKGYTDNDLFTKSKHVAQLNIKKVVYVLDDILKVFLWLNVLFRLRFLARHILCLSHSDGFALFSFLDIFLPVSRTYSTIQ
jgi:hypothetical protein